MSSVADAVSDALPVQGGPTVELDLRELQGELDRVAQEALAAREQGVSLVDALRRPEFSALRRFHQDLRDALFVEIPSALEGWVDGLRRASGPASDLGQTLTDLARQPEGGTDNAELQRALAELLLFESVRLRLLIAAWHSGDYERLGGDEDDIDEIAWEEVSALLRRPELEDDDVRPLQLMFAAASLALARDAAERAGELRHSGSEVRDELSMRARLRAALRELRLPESVLLENALSNLLGQDRQELGDLQASHRVALDGLTRQAMDQRVSRGRRALTRGSEAWPRRRRPALFDILAPGPSRALP